MPNDQQLEESAEVTEQTDPQTDSHQPEPPQEGEQGKTFDAEYVEKLRKENAKYRTEARENAAAAKRLKDIEEAQKSDLQKAIERAEAAEGALGALQAAEQLRGWKDEISKETGVPAATLRGNDLDEIREHALSIKALLPEPRKAGQVPAEGRTVTTGSGDPAQQFADLIRNARR